MKQHSTDANTAVPTRGAFATAIGNLLRLPETRAGKLWKLATFAAVPLLIVLPVALLSYLAKSKPVTNAEAVTLAHALSALDHGDYKTARTIAQKIRQSETLAEDELGGPTFVLGAITALESETVRADVRGAYAAMAAQLLAESRELGFPQDYEASGLYLLGRSLLQAGKFNEAAATLEAALPLNSNLKSEINNLLAVAYARCSPPQLSKAVEHGKDYLAGANLSEDEHNAAWLRQAEFLYELKDYANCRHALDQVLAKSEQFGRTLVIRAQLLMDEARALSAKPADLPSPVAVSKYQAAIKALRQVQSAELELNTAVRESMYLIGRCLLESGEKQAALNQFARTRQLLTDGPEALSASLEEADLLLDSGNSSEALEAYCTVATTAGLVADQPNRLVPTDAFRGRIMAAYQHYLNAEQFAEALRLAAHLDKLLPEGRRLELMAQVKRAWGNALALQASKLTPAEAAPIVAESRSHLRESGILYRQFAAAQFATREYPEAIWNSAENFLEGHDYSNAIVALEEYLKYELRRRQARALLNLGEAHLALGNLELAIRALTECSEVYPRDVASYRARLLASKAYIEMGDPAKAETLLLENLEGDSLTPASKEWRESLFALGMLLHSELRLPEAIQRLTEAVARYPDHPQAIEGHYIIAQSYRALAAKAREKMVGQNAETSRNALGREVDRLLTSALAGYQHVQEALARRQQDAELTAAEKSIMRNCTFARAVTLFELDRFDEAIRAYSNATNRYQHEPEVLNAFVQMMYCYRRLGRDAEARGSLEQAKIVLSRIKPDANFTNTTNYNRQEWAALLATLQNL